MKKLLMLFSLLLIATSFAISQTVQISGTVTGSEDGLPLPGVAVTVKGTTIGVSTDTNGRYQISAPATAQVLSFQFIGFETFEVAIAGQTTINVSLKPSILAVDEVIVVAYGTTKKSAFTGSAAQINSEKIEQRPITNITRAIEGAAPGIQMTSGGGAPGSSGDIRIRGFGSINASSSPLYVVDGTPYSGSISNLNPYDIESISVLKDAATTALYGSRAANGVILVTTKKGVRNRNDVQFRASQGYSGRAIPEYERVGPDEYMGLMWESYRNSMATGFSGTFDLPTANQRASGLVAGVNGIVDLLRINPYNVANNQLLDADGVLNPAAELMYPEDLDWTDHIIRTGKRSDYALTLSGGTNRNDYFVSLGYTDDNGFAIKTDLERFTGRINVNAQPRDFFRTGLNLTANMTKSNFASTGSSTGYVNPFFFTRTMGPIYPVYSHDPANGDYILDGSGNKVFSYLDVRGPSASSGRHIVAETLWNDRLFKRNVLGARTYFDILFLDGFKFTVNGSIDLTAYNASSYENKLVGDGAPGGRGSRTNSLTTSYSLNQLLTYTRMFGKHSVDFLAGHENYDFEYNYFYSMRTGVVVDGISELVNFTTTSSVTSYTDFYRTEGYLSRANYNYDGKYFFSGSYRRDGSSRFYKDSRWGNFFSVSGAWRIDQETFAQNLTWLDILKLRASYGEVGNDAGISYYAYQALYDLGRNNAAFPGYIQNSLANNDLVWEASKTSDIGIEFGVLNKISGSLEYFHRVSDNLLFSVPLPVSSGVLSQDQNIGTMYNEGVEAALSFNLIQNNNFSWVFDVNATTLKNKITKLPQEEIISGTKKLLVGKSIYDYWLRTWYGVDPADGAALYVADNTTAATGIRILGTDTVTTDQNNALYEYHGSAIPKVYGSFTNTLNFKGFTLSGMFTYQIGGKIYDAAYAALMHAGNYGAALHTDMMKRWTADNTITNVPRLDNAKVTPYGAQSSRFLTDASFLNLKSITLSYNLPKELLQKITVQNAMVYVSGENLKLWNGRVGMDSQQAFSGVTSNDYSPARTITFGINVTF
jgi:TonB-linked SusC/RagA family outer membrane protein